MTLTGFHLEGVGVFLLNGVGEVEARVAAVVSLGILQHDVGEVQVAVLALGDAFVLVDGLHGCRGEQAIQSESDPPAGGCIKEKSKPQTQATDGCLQALN